MACASCKNLTDIYCREFEVDEISENVFSDCSSELLFYLDRDCDFIKYLDRHQFRYVINDDLEQGSEGNGQKSVDKDSYEEADTIYNCGQSFNFIVKEIGVLSVEELELYAAVICRVEREVRRQIKKGIKLFQTSH